VKIEGYRFKGEKISLISIKETDVDMWSTTPSPADLQACECCQDVLPYSVYLCQNITHVRHLWTITENRSSTYCPQGDDYA